MSKTSEKTTLDILVINGPRVDGDVGKHTLKKVNKRVLKNQKLQGEFVGDGIHGEKQEVISSYLEHTSDETHMHYNGHAGIRNGILYLDITDEEDLPAVDMLARDRDSKGVRHIWACHAAKAKNVAMRLGDGKPCIFHSGEKYTALTALDYDGIENHIRFYREVKDEYGRPPNAYDAFEHSFLTSPETVVFSERVDGEWKTFKVSAPKQPVKGEELKRYLESELERFREFRKNELGDTEAIFLPLGPTGRQLRKYNEHALFVEASRENSEHAAEYVQAYLDMGIDPNITLGSGWTALHFAAELSGNLAMVHSLVQAGAEINKKDHYGRTPLLDACVKGNTGIAKYLMNKGADIEAADDSGRTPLTEACRDDNLSLVQHLVKAEADITRPNKHGTTPLMLACNHNNDQMPRFLLSKGVGIDNIDAQEEKGMTALYVLCANGNKDMAEGLVEHFKADINLALFTACKHGDFDTLKFICETFPKQVDLNHVDEHGWSPLTMACHHGHSHVTGFLLAQQPDLLNKPDNYGRTPFYHACEQERIDVVRDMMLFHGADIKQGMCDAVTPLMIVSWAGHKEIVSRILRHEDADYAYVTAIADEKKAEKFCKAHNLDILGVYDFLTQSAKTLAQDNNDQDIVSRIEKYEEVLTKHRERKVNYVIAQLTDPGSFNENAVLHGHDNIRAVVEEVFKRVAEQPNLKNEEKNPLAVKVVQSIYSNVADQKPVGKFTERENKFPLYRSENGNIHRGRSWGKAIKQLVEEEARGRER